MVTISCSGKLHAFALAEQIERHGMLDAFYTSYASQKNTFLHRFVKRTDKEQIPVEKIHTNSLLAFPMKLWHKEAHTWNHFFDQWVKRNISKGNSKVFVGWSGMSLHSIRAAKSSGKVTIVERGSAHILYQNEILQEEYARFGIKFSIDPRVIDKELKEYEEADYISIPSSFVHRSFLKYNVPAAKLLQNMYGVSEFFTASESAGTTPKFVVVYLGKLSIQKGLLYLFEALHQLNIPADKLEAHFIGGIDDDLKPTIEKCRKPNWTFFGHTNHYELPRLLSQCSVAIQPSLQDGMGMVIPQCLACGLPVIASENCGGAEIITPGKTGFVVPVRSPESIAAAIQQLYDDPALLAEMKRNAMQSVKNGLSWQDYGNRYVDNIRRVTQ